MGETSDGVRWDLMRLANTAQGTRYLRGRVSRAAFPRVGSPNAVSAVIRRLVLRREN